MRHALIAALAVGLLAVPESALAAKPDPWRVVKDTGLRGNDELGAIGFSSRRNGWVLGTREIERPSSRTRPGRVFCDGTGGSGRSRGSPGRARSRPSPPMGRTRRSPSGRRAGTGCSSGGAGANGASWKVLPPSPVKAASAASHDMLPQSGRLRLSGSINDSKAFFLTWNGEKWRNGPSAEPAGVQERTPQRCAAVPGTARVFSVARDDTHDWDNDGIISELVVK